MLSLAARIVNNPELLILDEPTVGIDDRNADRIFSDDPHMHQHHHMTFIMVSHDMDMMQSYLGTEPQQVSGGIKFYVKHTHDPEDCRETNLTHSIGQIREMIGVQ